MQGTSARICNELHSNQTHGSVSLIRRSRRRCNSDENGIHNPGNNASHRKSWITESSGGSEGSTSAFDAVRKLCPPTVQTTVTANHSPHHDEHRNEESDGAADSRSRDRPEDRGPVTFTQCIATIWYQKKGWRPYSRTRKSLPGKQSAKCTATPAIRGAGDANTTPVRTGTWFPGPMDPNSMSEVTVPVLETWDQLFAHSHANGRPIRLSNRTTRIIKLMEECEQKKEQKNKGNDQ